jgi:preprotein translocase subunit SecG
MYSFILFLHVIICMVLLTLVLLQRSKSSDIGSSFGAGASTTMFGSAGSTSFLVKLTAIFAILFFSTSLTLGALSTHVVVKTQTTSDVVLAAAQQTKITAPATPTLPQGPMPTKS